MTRYRRFRIVLTVLLLIVVLLSSFPATAQAISNPDVGPTVNNVYVYQFTDGSIGVLIDYYIFYTVVPVETATASFLAVFIAADGSTQLKAVAPFTYQNSGYGRGLIWIPFTAAEVTSFGLTSANQALYSVWLVGNPALSWPATPPKVSAAIGYWQTAGDASVLLALRVLYYADILELAWSISLLQVAPTGNKLSTLGESYFDNVIPGLPTLAPAAFASGSSNPIQPTQNYASSFGAVVTGGTGNVTGSPKTLVSGANSVTITAPGTLIFSLNLGTVGTVANGAGTVAGSPVRIVYGNNTVTATGAGLITVTVSENSTATQAEQGIPGTGFDMSAAAANFGMSRWMFSSLVWLAASILICGVVFIIGSQPDAYGQTKNTSKVVMLVFDVFIIGGGLLGLLHPIVAILLFIGWSVVIGIVLFYRNANV